MQPNDITSKRIVYADEYIYWKLPTAMSARDIGIDWSEIHPSDCLWGIQILTLYVLIAWLLWYVVWFYRINFDCRIIFLKSVLKSTTRAPQLHFSDSSDIHVRAFPSYHLQTCPNWISIFINSFICEFTVCDPRLQWMMAFDVWMVLSISMHLHNSSECWIEISPQHYNRYLIISKQVRDCYFSRCQIHQCVVYRYHCKYELYLDKTHNKLSLYGYDIFETLVFSAKWIFDA